MGFGTTAHVVTLVILPGMDGSGIELTEFIAALAPEMNAIVVTYPNDRPLDYAGHEAVARAEPARRIVRSCFSANRSRARSRSRSPRPLRPASSAWSCVAPSRRNPRPGLSWLRPLVRFLPPRIPAAIPSWLLLGRSATPRLKNALAEALAQITPDAFRARLTSILDIDVTEKLARIRLPVLYLRATQDRVVPPRSTTEIVTRCPATRVVEVESPHLFLQTAPSIAAQHLKLLLSRQLGRRVVTRPHSELIARSVGFAGCSAPDG